MQEVGGPAATVRREVFGVEFGREATGSPQPLIVAEVLCRQIRRRRRRAARSRPLAEGCNFASRRSARASPSARLRDCLSAMRLRSAVGRPRVGIGPLGPCGPQPGAAEARNSLTVVRGLRRLRPESTSCNSVRTRRSPQRQRSEARSPFPNLRALRRLRPESTSRSSVRTRRNPQRQRAAARSLASILNSSSLCRLPSSCAIRSSR